ncbi:MAG: 2-amino-4-hydroxy-6-hydroxymethyldihydropteridine diphosphokinase [Deltaproteobacteria bacterium]|nr:2-amino-4-hydroxy-6-hydroxymethyldihydropteridine diphosphokinase [Deltaproteobacteria bacterium]
MTEPIAIGIGGNIGTEAALIERFGRAREAISLLAGRAISAPLFRTAAIGPMQSPFLNTAVRITLPDAQPAELIAALLEIERLLGRQRTLETRWGPRTLDLDVLVWGARTLRTPELEVPHPRLAERRFALDPLVALFGSDFVVPGLGTVGTLVERVRDQRCEQIAEHW